MQKQNLMRVLFASVVAIAGGLLADVAVGADKGAVPQRSDIDARYKWNVEDIYPDAAAWEKDFNFVKDNITRFKQYQGHLSDSAGALLACLRLNDELGIILGDLQVYAGLKGDEDKRVSTYQELVDRAVALVSEVNEASSFIEPELLAMDSLRLGKFLEENKDLVPYRFHIQDLIRKKAHVLPEEQERLMALAGPIMNSASDIFGLVTNADITFGDVTNEKGEKVALTRERYTKMLDSPDRRVRREANQVFCRAHLERVNALAATLEACIKSDNFEVEARNYKSCLEMALSAGNIPVSVFDNLVAAVNANLAPLHKWANLRKRILGLDTLYSYDMYVPLLPGMDKQYTWDEATALVAKGLKPLGETYVADFQRALTAGWVDVYETQGKRSGAYSWGSYRSHPYVLLNFNGTLQHVFTVAHEMGHAFHRYLTYRNEPYTYAGHSKFVAEVASTCNEAILMKYLLKNAKDKKERMALIDRHIEEIIGTVYTQVLFSEFEKAIHDRIESDGAFSVDYFRKTYRDIYEKYWGPEVVLDSVNDVTGLRISHLYRRFYVYQYATSYTAAEMISQKIVDGEKGYLNRYMEFLKTGNSAYPVDVLRKAGVDMTTPEPVNRTLKLFSDLVDEMERLLNEK
jgi:oligoendopeptidase F